MSEATTTADWQRADELFETLRELCGAESKDDAVKLLTISLNLRAIEPEAMAACKALTVLIKHWPEPNPIPGE